ncbi:L domain-like protein [Neocallimastix californiae]|uniref:L domain-like protein n=1 Tax=Neocallimastix californiae TaxID=1754190 RepID=A0A1Y2FTB1_9FUNG|nr:L domain-like protein [Neocallimastix californiae]|eukprot:ORY87251.1 L domain-like protein [Neocallimastix californiae]
MVSLHFFIQKTLYYFVTLVLIFNLPRALADIEDCTILERSFKLLGLKDISDHYSKKTVVSPSPSPATAPSCCDINGLIKCENINGKKYVTELHLRNYNFNGKDMNEVFEQLSKIPKLHYISLAEDAITGSIPKSISKIKQLTNLSLRKNQLTGAIPENLNELTNLVYLDLSENNLNGEIPKSLGKLSNLKVLKLNNNGFSGAIPYSFKDLKNLEQLQLSNTAITGYVPEFPKMNNCTFTNTNICYLSQSKLSCKVDIKECSDEDIKNTDSINGRNTSKSNDDDDDSKIDGDDKGLSGFTIFIIIVAIILVVVIISLLIYKYINNNKEGEEATKFVNYMDQNTNESIQKKEEPSNNNESKPRENTVLNTNNISTTQNVNEILPENANDVSCASITNMPTIDNDLLSPIMSSGMASTSPFLNSNSFISMNPSDVSSSQLVVPSASLNKNSYSVSNVNSIMASPSITSYYMPNYPVVDQTSPEYINTMNAIINGHNVFSLEHSANPIAPNRQKTTRVGSRSNAKKITKEEEARIVSGAKENNNNNNGDNLPSYEEL